MVKLLLKTSIYPLAGKSYSKHLEAKYVHLSWISVDDTEEFRQEGRIVDIDSLVAVG